LKYVNVKLESKNSILIFYRDICAHKAQYNVFLSPIDEISETVGSRAELFSAHGMDHIGDILYTKFKADGAIKYDHALISLQTAKNSYEFLDFCYIK